jgi:hypothetical protein
MKSEFLIQYALRNAVLDCGSKSGLIPFILTANGFSIFDVLMICGNPMHWIRDSAKFLKHCIEI